MSVHVHSCVGGVGRKGDDITDHDFQVLSLCDRTYLMQQFPNIACVWEAIMWSLVACVGSHSVICWWHVLEVIVWALVVCILKDIDIQLQQYRGCREIRPFCGSSWQPVRSDNCIV